MIIFYSYFSFLSGEEAYNRYAPLFYSSLDYHILNLDLDLDIDLLELELDSNLDLDLDYYLSLYGLNYLGKSRHFWKAGKHIPLMLGHLYGLGISHLGSFGLGYGLGYSLGYGYDKYGITDEIEDHLEDHSDSHVGFGLNLDHHFNFGHDFHHSDLSDDEDDDHVVSESSFGWFKR